MIGAERSPSRALPRRFVAITVAAACTALCAEAHAAPDDPWFGTDKLLHFSVSAALSGGGYAASALVLEEPPARALAGAGFSLTMGIGKELYDLHTDGDPSMRDLVWDVAGTAVGVGIAVLIDLALREPSQSAGDRSAQVAGFRF
jgi:uncharacterized protein YfiM (DUF2279 family)